jgi:hypothetical protein
MQKRLPSTRANSATAFRTIYVLAGRLPTLTVINALGFDKGLGLKIAASCTTTEDILIRLTTRYQIEL